MPKAIVVTSGREVRIARPSKLEEYQALVDGYIEPIWVRPRAPGDAQCVVLVNEEGLLAKLPRNTLIERFIAANAGISLSQPLVGTAVVMGRKGEDFGDVPGWAEAWFDEVEAEAHR